jgi:hypothetical protein
MLVAVCNFGHGCVNCAEPLSCEVALYVDAFVRYVPLTSLMLTFRPFTILPTRSWRLLTLENLG